jgi:hypothetical protein
MEGEDQKVNLEYELQSMHQKLDSLRLLVEHLTNKVEQLEVKKKKVTIDYKLQPFRFPQMRCQNLMKKMLTELVETQCPQTVKRLIGMYNYGGFCSILGNLIQELFNKPELMSIYIKGLRFYVYTSNSWVEWKKPSKDCLRAKFWGQFKQYMSAYMSREDDYLTKKPCWDLLIDTESFVGHITKRRYIRNIMKVNGELGNMEPPFGNTGMTSILLKNIELMTINRKHFKKKL